VQLTHAKCQTITCENDERVTDEVVRAAGSRSYAMVVAHLRSLHMHLAEFPDATHPNAETTAFCRKLDAALARLLSAVPHNALVVLASGQSSMVGVKKHQLAKMELARSGALSKWTTHDEQRMEQLIAKCDEGVISLEIKNAFGTHAAASASSAAAAR
jgi:hypothetical protein